MIYDTINQKLIDYIKIYTLLKEKLKWKVADQRTLMLIASMYVVNKKSFDSDRFFQISDYIKNNVGAFSILKSYQRFTTAAMLDIHFENPEKKFDELIEWYEELVKGGFSRGTFTYISAFSLLKDANPQGNRNEKIERALAVYKGMQKKHYFLTSAADYPLAVMVANRKEPIDELIDLIEEFYDQLHENGFKKGNDLQFLSHILSLDYETNRNELVSRCMKLWDTFNQLGRKPKSTHYPEIGMLALIEDGTEQIKTIETVTKELNTNKLFKWHKDMNFMMAVNLTLSGSLEDPSFMETSFHSIIEAIIQAQQAAMIAAFASVTAASSSGS
ncbi:MAG TPA: DUF4003 family protein [Bacillus sp. (in: firmicutes)]|uniref:DUF4003 family protein n=1 Tax=Bacillus litorisediminis TaxID=2922713 RepID=UPI001FAD1065|nr:DUF4003 family protein [Bacillus litorisediminis]HWO75322.1 DUF4003 family protein [Bacillus sp. (in: firmicutes)]